MTLRLRIDAERWHAHQEEVLRQVPGLVPVAKGNGYGFGLDLLAQESCRLGVDVIAVGIAEEVAKVRAGGWDGDVVVLNPWRPGDQAATALLADDRITTTVSRADDLRRIAETTPGARVIVELLTSMRRHGLAPEEAASLDLGGVALEGWAIHLPAAGSLSEAQRLAAAPQVEAPFWLSHLSVDDYLRFAAESAVPTRMRVGTRLWLGDKQAYRTTATVLDVHRVAKGTSLGYHQAKAPRDGFIVVVSGGTAHGVALAAPVPQRSPRQRLVTVAEGVLSATGRAMSPFVLGGKKRPFAEPPHMHSSMLFVAGADPLVKIGDDVDVTVRMTTTTPDEIVGL
ncbi:MAG TPA: alanine racemase [Arachnia sp.]|nr:alanine racemase [Arachnia sp.]HMT85251.1 alanine racemase [Arachnia sp.]